MKPWQWVFTLFSLFIALMLVKQAYDYNSALANKAEVPEQDRFYDSGAAAAKMTIVPANAANVYQKTFTTSKDPSGATFTGISTLMNKGTAKAVDVQVFIRPFRNGQRGNSTNDGNHGGMRGFLPDNDPVSQIGQWVSVPDIAPGETATASATFILRSDVMVGVNPSPEINFGTEKSGADTKANP